MFEKLLQAIELDPSRQKRTALLALLSQIENLSERARTLASYARILARIDTMEAFTALHYAWRLSPGDSIILGEAKAMFLALRRGEAAAKVEEMRSPDIRALPSEANVTIRAGEPPPTPECRSPEKPQPKATTPQEIEIDFLASLDLSDLKSPEPPDSEESLPIPLPDNALELDLSPKIEDASPPFTPAPPFETEAPHEKPAAPDNSLLLTFSESGTGPYGLFHDFARTAGVDFHHLEYMEGFSDSLLGLLHFVHYLQVSGRISGPSREQALLELRGRVMVEIGDIKCQARFLDLFEPTSGER